MKGVGGDDFYDQDLVGKMAALSSPHRLRIVAMLHEHGRKYVSELARLVGMSRPLLYLHLDKLEAAGLVRGELSLSSDGKALKWFEARDFELTLSPATIAAAAASPPSIASAVDGITDMEGENG